MSAQEAREARRQQLRAALAEAARVVPRQYPLRSFVAVNPLGGLESLPFADALELCRDVYGVRCLPAEQWMRGEYARGRVVADDLHRALARALPGSDLGAQVHDAGRPLGTLADVLRADLLHGAPAAPPARGAGNPDDAGAADVDRLTSTWLAAYAGAPTSGWPMPGHERGFWPAWRDLAPRDRSLPRTARQRLRDTPGRSDDAVLDALDALDLAPARWTDWLTGHLARQPGWAAYVFRRAEDGPDGIDLLDLVAVRACYASALGAHAAPSPGDVSPDRSADPARPATVLAALGAPDTASARRAVAAVLDLLPPERRALVWLDAYEEHYRADLLGRLARPPADAPARRAAAQLICCIDTRSEGLRRRFESRGDYETLGFAGFFGVGMRFTDVDGTTTDQCPVLIPPTWSVRERDAAGPSGRHALRRRMADAAVRGVSAAKGGTLAPLAFVEPAGAALAPVAAARTAAPRTARRLADRLRRIAVPPASTRVAAVDALPPADRVGWARSALTTMGLTQGFAPVVVLCGHAGSSTNNPFAATLHCGACGGRPGGANARAAAELLNDPATRSGLAAEGIEVPRDTWFVAAEHDTTTDEVTLFDVDLVPASHRAALEQVRADLAGAGAALAAERCADLPGAPVSAAASAAAATRHVAGRSADWAQVVPEWGLAGNAAFVVGPRTLTAGLDLGRRVFLHSYDTATDPEGTALEAILTAPLVVAHGISCQYYFSTVAPETFGAGTKTVHNPLGGVGVLTGPGGDLRLGLPAQSVAVGSRVVHEPVRLVAVVQAPLERIDAVLTAHPTLRGLVDNDWLALVARPSPADPWSRHVAGRWCPVPVPVPA